MDDQEYQLKLIAALRLENRRLKGVAKKLRPLLDGWRKQETPDNRRWIAWLETLLGEMEN
jgi:hypothetical protein